MKSDTICEFCGGEIRWCDLIDDGGRIALDAVPVVEPKGAAYAVAGAGSAKYVPVQERAGRRLYTKHSETCVEREKRNAHYRRRHRGRAGARGEAARAAVDALGVGETYVWRKPR